MNGADRFNFDGWEILAEDNLAKEIVYVFAQKTGALRMVDLGAEMFVDQGFPIKLSREAAISRIDTKNFTLR